MLNLAALNGRRMDAAAAPVASAFLRSHAQLVRQLPREQLTRNWKRVRAERAVASALHGVPDIPPLAKTFHENRMLVETSLPHNSYLKLLSDISKKEKEKEQSAKAV